MSRRSIVSRGGGKGAEGAGGARDAFEVEYRYDPKGTLGRDETRPILMMWMGPRTGAYAVHRHRLVALPGRGQKFAAVRVRFPYDARRPLAHDTSFHAILLSTIKSSEGQITYEKGASAQVHLADLLADYEGVVQEGGRAAKAGARIGAKLGGGRGGEGWTRRPMRVQSYYMPTPGQDRPELVEAERHKGDLHLRLRRAPARGLRLPWAKPSGIELTPANVPSLQKAMMSAVNRTMAPFHRGARGEARGEASGGAGEAGEGAVAATEREILNVHAPLYVQETEVPLDGATFWSRAPIVAREHVRYAGGATEGERYLEQLLRQSMGRHDVTEAEFLWAAASFDARAAPHARAAGLPGGRNEYDDEEHDASVRRALAVVGTAMTMRGNMMKYVSDKVVLAKTGREVVVESFDQADTRTANARDSGGVQSQDLLPAGMVAPNPDDDDDDDRNVASGGAIDCEDAGRDAAVHFALLSDPGAGLPDEGLTSPLVSGARAMAQHYRAVGALCSVLSRNLADARRTAGDGLPCDDTPSPYLPAGAPIGSPEDERVEVGAHMFLLLIPDTTLRQSMARALDAPSRLSRTAPTVDMPPPAVGASAAEGLDPHPTPLLSGRDLPVLLCEGTGVLHPLMRASEAYETSQEGRERAALGDVLRQEAYVRLNTGRSSAEIAQRMMAQHPRMVMGGVDGGGGGDGDDGSGPPAAMDKFQEMHRQDAVVDDPEARIVPTFYRTAAEFYMVPTAAQLDARLRRARPRPSGQLVGDRLIPMQIGGRAGRHSPAGQTWGTPISYVVRQREEVALLPTPEPTPVESRIVDRVHQHLAPTVPLRRDLDPHSDRYIREATRWPALFTAASRLPPVTDEHRDLALRREPERYVMVHKYADPRDLNRAQVAELAQWMGRNNRRFVKAGSLALERTTERLATVRIDALVDCGDTADRVRNQVRALF